jgi:ankyrin repeat protein
MRRFAFFLLLVICFGCHKSSADELRDVKPKNADKGSTVLQSLHVTFADGTDDATLELVKDNPTLVHDMDDSQCTALHYAARYGRLETAKWLIQKKAEVNTVSYNKFTPMHMAKDGAVARLLIKAKADLKAKDAWGKTPLQYAAQEEREDVCDAIIESGFPIDLSTALWLGKRDLVKTMIKENPAIAKLADGGSDLWGNTTPLGLAALKGDKEIVELLIKAGAPVNGVTKRPNWGPITPLCNAVWAKQHEVAEILCKAGADCNMTGGRLHPRLLDYALEHSDRKMVDLLVRYGAKASEKK